MKKIFTSILSIVLLNCGHTLLAQTITTPTGTPLSVTSNIEVSGDVNIPVANSFKINGTGVLSIKSSNLFVGPLAGNPATTGIANTFIGLASGQVNGSGSFNLFLGSSAGANNTSGSFNMYMGNDAGGLTTGSFNTYLGAQAGYGVLGSSSGGDNVFIGSNSGKFNTSGSRNVFIGSSTGADFATPANSNSAGSDNTYVGYLSKASAPGLTNATAIGSNSVASLSNTVVLGNAATTVVGAGLASPRSLSGLVLAGFTSGSPTTPIGGSRVLTVDGSGNVILALLPAGVVLQSTGGSTSPLVDNVADKSVSKVDDIQAKALDTKISDLDARITKISNEKNTWKEDNGFLYNNSTKGVVINGTGFDGQALIVKGKMLSEEVNVKVQNSDWPDYVFKPSYKRMTLDEVEKFININGHLPNVASATEMAATGNNLNKTDIKLLEKVEELTLYLLEMKKSNEAQNAEIQNLKKQVKSLRRK